MTIAQKRANKEVLVILKELNLLNEIPQNVLNNLSKNQDENWVFVYDTNLKLEEQKMLRDTAVLFSTLYLMYICKDDEEKESLKLLYEENEKKNIEASDFEVLMRKREEEKAEKKLDTDTSMIEVKETLLNKILKWMKSVFKF